jgi:hypothetical protein
VGATIVAGVRARTSPILASALPARSAGSANMFVSATGRRAAATRLGATAQWGNATGTIAAGMPSTTTRSAPVDEKGLNTS